MEYVYAALILHETGAEINESNLTAVLESAEADATTSRIKAVVAALEDVDLAATKAKTMATGGAAPAVPEADDDADIEPEAVPDDEETADSGSLDTLFEDSDEGDGTDDVGAASDGEQSPDAGEDAASDDETGA
ncbi:50S ribosomal protein P1 [Haloarcula pellucida]|uniref:50S ribosomal protein P1 n=1 Tax=Haloarcula pellucida TaxID=1427151 RepID=A0A830GJP8_9EURY|nr:50S ribosomal protein P1 [Halomicroarcula pellucida]MBX0348615.1 50S ribosomal protein P1 [Halomicroarcula pellucida]GGN92567.1 50S ribosomal protein P1 [Halomicroarcula pellucida]